MTRQGLVIAVVLCALARIGLGDPPKGTLRITVTRYDCRGCGQRQDSEGTRVGKAKLSVQRGKKQVATVTTRDDGVATLALDPGSYCATYDGTTQCGKIGAGSTTELRLAVHDCPPLHCTGREP